MVNKLVLERQELNINLFRKPKRNKQGIKKLRRAPLKGHTKEAKVAASKAQYRHAANARESFIKK